MLLVELDGVAAQVADDTAAVAAICRGCGAFEIRDASTADERAVLWRGRKGAFAAMGRVSPDYYVQDGVVPRTKLPEVLRQIEALSSAHGLRVGNVFHAGDGNLHPLVLYDGAVDGEYERAKTLADAILAACVDAGGSLTGRARDRRRQGVRDAVDVLRARPRRVRARQARLRPRRARKPRQGAADAEALRRGARPVPPTRARAGRPRGAVLMLRPSSLDEAATLFAAASAEGRTVQIGVDLDMAGLDRVLEHEAGDLTCTVEAGIRLSALAGALSPAGQRLSLDPPGDPTIGACIARRLSGPLSHRYGTPRDLVLGVTVVLGDGTVASSGGKVVKNVAGYDLGKLMCGSEGKLGLVARVALRLHPSPAARATLVVETDDPADVVRAVRGSTLQPSAVDVLHPGRVAILLEGGESAVAAQLGAAKGLVGGIDAGDEVWAESRERQASAPGRLRFAPGDLANVLTTLPEAVVRPSAGIAYVPHLVGGVPGAAARRVHRALKERLDPAGVLG